MLAGGSLSAQQLTSDYIAWPSSTSLATYVNQWKNGTLSTTMEDENFFIGRVKPHKQFRNTETQINPQLTETNDKRLVFWVPVGDSNNGLNTNALPNGMMNSEVFSMWSYVSHYGNWTSPHGWVPGAFSDVAHKNGVGVSGVASIPYGTITSAWSSALTSQRSLTATDLAAFLHVHGVDGLGYNSEFSGYGSTGITALQNQHQTIITYLKGKGNDLAENIWYDGTNSYGSITFDQGLTSSNIANLGDASGNRRASLFFNYNWNVNTSMLSTAVSKAATYNLSPLYIYAGFNMQGGQPSTNNWTYLKNYNISIGLWGAHNNNMLWLARNEEGSEPATMQRTYQKLIEQWFGNGPRNPSIAMEVKDRAKCAPDDTFFGMSAFMTAHSALNWSLDEEPFITNFNLGNGAFFNWKGVRQNSNEWYNIGVQDYLPTWRFWWSKELRGRSTAEGSIGLDATFTWDDAYLGGSCLRITGTDANCYLHLFKTKYELKSNDEIKFIYKHLKGDAKVSLILAVEGAETAAVRESDLLLLDLGAEADEDLWVEKAFTVSRQLGSQLNGKTLALVGLHFENAQNLDMMLGGFSVTRPDAGLNTTPDKPTIKLTKVLANHYKGVDAKIIFNMPNTKAYNEPCYNLDVKTSFFKLYAQEEGGQPIFMGITTSWAGMYYSTPCSDSNARIRFGVAAVSVDQTSDSDIAWSDYISKGTYNVSSDIEISQTTLKPDEGFTIKYTDPQHAASNWVIYNNKGVKMAEATASTFIEVPQGFSELGGYDLVIDEGTSAERRFGYYVQISSKDKGAVPQIQSIAVNGKETTDNVSITTGEEVTLSYTGREADGSGSRALSLDEKWFGVQVSQLGIEARQSFSVAGWVKLSNLPSGISNFVTIENRSGSWPANNWGFFWSRISGEGKFVYNQIDGCWGARLQPAADGNRLYSQYDQTKIGLNAWTHFAIVFEYNASGELSTAFYINGVKQTMTAWMYVYKSTYNNYCDSNLASWADLKSYKDTYGNGVYGYGENVTQTGYAATTYTLTTSDWISFGGSASNINAVQGLLDDFQVWGKAMTDEEVAASMAGFDANNLPSGLLALFDFEQNTNSDNSYTAKGTKAGAKGYYYNISADAKEGQGNKVNLQNAYDAGCPFIPGEAFVVKTEPTWTAKKAIVSASEGNDKAGSATLSYKKAGDHTVTLSLTNSHGTDSKTFPVFNVAEASGIDNADLDETKAYSVDGTVFVRFQSADRYQVAVYGINGAVAAQRTIDAADAQLMRIDINQPGIYVVKIDGSKCHRAFKLQVK